LASPEYTVLRSAGTVEVANVATEVNSEDGASVAVPNKLGPSKNCTVPLGAMPALADGSSMRTVAVRWLRFRVAAVWVFAFLRNWVKTDRAGTCVASPV